MSTGLYFPHTTCNDEQILKSALFLFDQLEYIVPYKGYEDQHPPKNSSIRRALSIIGKPIVPTSIEKTKAKKEIETVCRSNITDNLNFKLKDEESSYLIFPDKFSWETWKFLERKKLTKQLGGKYGFDYITSRGLGHFMMAMLALSCAGKKKQLVTNYPDAFKALYLASADKVSKDINLIANAKHRLLNIKTKSFDFSNIPFSKLIDLRDKESSLLTELRKNYYSVHSKYMSEIESVSDNSREIDDCVTEYAIEAEKGLAELKSALRMHATTTLLSKSVISTVAGIASETIVPSSGYLASAAYLTGELANYNDKRRNLLKNNKFAWLYVSNPRFKLY